MAATAVYPYKYADILPVEISRNCIITGYAGFVLGDGSGLKLLIRCLKLKAQYSFN